MALLAATDPRRVVHAVHIRTRLGSPRARCQTVCLAFLGAPSRTRTDAVRILGTDGPHPPATKATGLANLPCTGPTPRRLAGNHPGRNRSGGLDQTDRLPRPHRSGHLRGHHLPLPRPARRGRHHPRRPKGPLAHRRDLAVGHRDLPSMAMTSGSLPLTTRPPVQTDPRKPGPGKPAHRATPDDPSHPPATITPKPG